VEIGQKIKVLRKKYKMSQLELAKKTGYTSYTSIAKIEAGKIDLSRSKLIKFATALDTTPAYLMGWNELSLEDIGATPVTDFEWVNVPILGSVRCGPGGTAIEELLGHEPVLAEWVKDGTENYFLLRITGDSMVPRFLENDLVLIRKQKSVDSGSLAVVIVDEEEGTVKRVVYGPDWIHLISENPAYPPRVFGGKDVLRVYVSGKVVKMIRNEP
jgi:repressor LexA